MSLRWTAMRIATCSVTWSTLSYAGHTSGLVLPHAAVQDIATRKARLPFQLKGDIARLAEAPDGTVILDVPCGGGVAFRGLRPGQRVRYVAADLSPVMLGRAPR